LTTTVQPPIPSQVKLAWQLVGVQVYAVPPHAPALHTSPWVQASPSLHGVPLAIGGLPHWPVVGLHVPATWHWSCAEHVTGLAPTHEPAWQVSLCVQAFPSLHADPSALAGLPHWPVVGLHVPAAWHWSGAEHVTGLAPTHAPDWHVSLCVHAFPSAASHAFAAGRQTVAAGIGVQVPRWPARLQAWQSLVPPPHAVLQQTPSTQ
jgi:hypothetical protein